MIEPERERASEREKGRFMSNGSVDYIKYDDVVIIYCHVNHILSLYLMQ